MENEFTIPENCRVPLLIDSLADGIRQNTQAEVILSHLRITSNHVDSAEDIYEADPTTDNQKYFAYCATQHQMNIGFAKLFVNHPNCNEFNRNRISKKLPKRQQYAN